MESPRHAVLLAVGCLLIASGAQAAKLEPSDCPCYDMALDLVAESTCTTLFEFSRFGRGKDRWTRQAFWTEGDTCRQFNVSALSARVDARRGEQSGMVCMVEPGDFCRVTNLTPTEIRACDRVLKMVRRNVHRLPDC